MNQNSARSETRHNKLNFGRALLPSHQTHKHRRSRCCLLRQQDEAGLPAPGLPLEHQAASVFLRRRHCQILSEGTCIPHSDTALPQHRLLHSRPFPQKQLDWQQWLPCWVLGTHTAAPRFCCRALEAKRNDQKTLSLQRLKECLRSLKRKCKINRTR